MEKMIKGYTVEEYHYRNAQYSLKRELSNMMNEKFKPLEFKIVLLFEDKELTSLKFKKDKANSRSFFNFITEDEWKNIRTDGIITKCLVNKMVKRAINFLSQEVSREISNLQNEAHLLRNFEVED